MSQPEPSSSPSANVSAATDPILPLAIDRSCRELAWFLFIGAAFWLLLSSVFGVIASIKFHGPGFLADHAWLTYGRVRAAQVNLFLYGFCLQAGLGVALWLIARLGQSLLPPILPAMAGAVLWNIGVAIGLFGILNGDGTGFETFEFPVYSAGFLLIGYLLLGLTAFISFHHRRRVALYVTQWYLVAGLFWFAWIFLSAVCLLLVFPSRGVAQASIAWWYTDNLRYVWFWLIGIGALFYFLPNFVARPLYSRALALFTFWFIILFGSWGGIPRPAPLPAWMPVLSTISRVLGTMAILAVFLNIHGTVQRKWGMLTRGVATPDVDRSALRFFSVSLFALFTAGILRLATAFGPVSRIVDFTWFTFGLAQLNDYGFFALTLFGAAYYLLPRALGAELSAPLIKAHFWLALAGLVVGVLPMLAGGVLQGTRMHNPDVPFIESTIAALRFLRVSTLGDLLLLTGNALFLFNLVTTLVRVTRRNTVVLYSSATADLYPIVEARR